VVVITSPVVFYFEKFRALERPDVLTVLRAKGRGWQTLVDQALREKFLNAKV
jgi:hypothetical protein